MFLLRIGSLLLTVLTLVPSAAHLFEFSGKIILDREPYFIVQGIYAGWSMFAIVIIAAILVNLILAFCERRADRRAAIYSLSSALLIALSLGLFFVWIFPGNQATANWTEMPENWEILRRQWEYGHVVNAIIVFCAFVTTALAVVRR